MSVALALVAQIYFAPPVAAQPPEVQVRLRVQRELKTIDLNGFELQISAAGAPTPVRTPHHGLNDARITRRKDGKWQVKWKGSSEPPLVIESETLKVSGEMLRIGPKPVPHHLEIHKGKNGLDVIAKLDLETYLAGVIPSEMPASWPIEALKAQAVAARSFAMRSRLDRQSRHFDVDSTVIDQVYKFLAEAEEDPQLKARINKVLQETRGQYLADPSDRVLRAFYSADCGCQSEDPKFVWGTVEAFQSVKDPTCSRRKPTKWDLSLERAEVRSRLIAALDLPANANLRTMHVSGRTPSGRVADVVASFEVGGVTRATRMPAQKFRKIFGFERIRSADFSLRWFAGQLLINGNGLGHGVGLCQMGARALADEGMDYRSILKLYYPKAKLKTRKQA